MALLLFQFSIVFTVGLFAGSVQASSVGGGVHSISCPEPSGPRLGFTVQPPRHAIIARGHAVVLPCVGHIRSTGLSPSPSQPAADKYPEDQSYDETEYNTRVNVEDNYGDFDAMVLNKVQFRTMPGLEVDKDDLSRTLSFSSDLNANTKNYNKTITKRSSEVYKKDHNKKESKKQEVYRSGNGDPAVYKYAITYKWFFNNELLNASDSKCIQMNNGSLYIKRMGCRKSEFSETGKASAVGEYRCVFNASGVGAIISQASIVSVAVLNRTFEEVPEDTQVLQGTHASLRCRINSVPDAVISWQKNGLLLAQNHRYQQVATGSLLIMNSQLTDSGSFRCVANNTILKKLRYSPSATLTVSAIQGSAELPIAEGHYLLPALVSQSLTAIRGSNVSLYCAAINSSVMWTYTSPDNYETPIQASTERFNLIDVQLSHMGNYTCRATKDRQNSFQIYSLQVLQPPSFVYEPASIQCALAKTVRFNCSAVGIPIPNVTWYKDGRALKIYGRVKLRTVADLKMSELRIIDPIITDAGNYQCMARNSAGEVSASAVLAFRVDVQLRPAPPSDIRCFPLNSTSVLLKWSSPVVDSVPFTVHIQNAEGGPEMLKLAEKGVNSSEILMLQPLIPYDFYVKLYFNNSVSDQSKVVRCSPQGASMSALYINKTHIFVKWIPINSTRPVVEYVLQWRSVSNGKNISEVVLPGNQTHYFIQNFIPTLQYEVRILGFMNSTVNNQSLENVQWISPSDRLLALKDIKDSLKNNNTSSNSPLVKDLKSWYIDEVKDSVNITWSYETDDEQKFIVFQVCYLEISASSVEIKLRGDVLKEEGCVKTESSWAVINELKPYRLYELKVRGEDPRSHTYGPYSTLEVHTREDKPERVRDLSAVWKVQDTVIVSWTPPQSSNTENLTGYVVKYCMVSIDIHCKNDGWKTRLLDSHQHKLELRIELSNIIIITVCAKTSHGQGIPVKVSVQRPLVHVPPNEPPTGDDPIIGIILGIVLSLACIALCLWTLNQGGRCSKGRDLSMLDNIRCAPGTTLNGHASLARTPTTVLHNSAQNHRACTELHEMQQLVNPERAVTCPPVFVPLLSGAQVDTKGGSCFSNGVLNKNEEYRKKEHLTNGSVLHNCLHITENPQFNSGAYRSQQPLLDNIIVNHSTIVCSLNTSHCNNNGVSKHSLISSDGESSTSYSSPDERLVYSESDGFKAVQINTDNVEQSSNFPSLISCLPISSQSQDNLCPSSINSISSSEQDKLENDTILKSISNSYNTKDSNIKTTTIDPNWDFKLDVHQQHKENCIADKNITRLNSLMESKKKFIVHRHFSNELGPNG